MTKDTSDASKIAPYFVVEKSLVTEVIKVSQFGQFMNEDLSAGRYSPDRKDVNTQLYTNMTTTPIQESNMKELNLFSREEMPSNPSYFTNKMLRK